MVKLCLFDNTEAHKSTANQFVRAPWLAKRNFSITVTDLITGGGGFIGRHLVQLLCRRGRKVRVFDIEPGNDFPPEVEVIRGCITDPIAIQKALSGIDTLYHLAGNPNLWTPRKTDFDRVHYLGTRTVLEAASQYNLNRIIFTSTESILTACKMSQERGSVDESVEGSLEEMPGPYCRSKYKAEQAALAAARQGQPVIVVNPTLPIGAGDRRLTPPMRMLLGFLNGKFPAYLECTLNFVDVRDVALGHVLAAERGKIGERYILGGQNLRLSTVLGMLERMTGLKMPRIQVPYLMALGFAALEELRADFITGHMPVAPLTGVRLSKHHLEFDCSKAARFLGFLSRPIIQALHGATAYLIAQGLVRRPLLDFPTTLGETAEHTSASNGRGLQTSRDKECLL